MSNQSLKIDHTNTWYETAEYKGLKISKLQIRFHTCITEQFLACFLRSSSKEVTDAGRITSRTYSCFISCGFPRWKKRYASHINCSELGYCLYQGHLQWILCIPVHGETKVHKFSVNKMWTFFPFRFYYFLTKS